MQKSLITMTITVEAILPNDMPRKEFVKLFPWKDAKIVETIFESEQFLEKE